VLQTYIPFLPKGAKPINSHVAIYFHDKKFESFALWGPIHSCWESDLYGARLPQGFIVTQTATAPLRYRIV
jgi:hypothetical protein